VKAVVGKNQQVVGSSPSAGSIQIAAGSYAVDWMGLEVFEIALFFNFCAD
jgi:hypothetical protein